MIQHPTCWYNHNHIDGLVQERCNSIANTLELHLSCINPSIYNCTTAFIWSYHFCCSYNQMLLISPSSFFFHPLIPLYLIGNTSWVLSKMKPLPFINLAPLLSSQLVAAFLHKETRPWLATAANKAHWQSRNQSSRLIGPFRRDNPQGPSIPIGT